MKLPSVLLAVIILYQMRLLNAKSSVLQNVINIPGDAKPGHIIAVLNTGEKYIKSQILPSLSQNGVSDYVSLSHNGVLALKSNVTQFTGRTVPITVQHESPNKQWKEEVHLMFDKSVAKVHFSAGEYTGSISENQPTGTYVADLNEFAQSIQSFPVECVFTLESGDVGAYKLARNSNRDSVYLVSEVVFDRELKYLYSLVVKAECPGGINAYTQVNIVVTDMNDNVPEFGMDFYAVNLKSADLTINKEILQVEAFDEDVDNEIIYSLSKNELFDICPMLGKITLVRPEQMTQKMYDLLVYAQDQEGHTSKPATVHITVDDSPMIIFEEFDFFAVHKIQKRDVQRDDRSYVVRGHVFGQMFSVAPMFPMEGERYYFVEPAPENLTLDSVSGMVFRENNHMWENTTQTFMVNITHGGEWGEMQVTVYIESDLDWETPILTNEPLPLMARVPIWIRPYTTIYTAQAKIVEQYRVQVHYRIESGAEGRFYIEPFTGEIKIQDRGEFIEGHIYELAISAQTVGNAPRTDTPSQVVMVQVEDMVPQFYLNPYVIDVPETSLINQVVGIIKAKSFQELPLEYSVQFDKLSDANLFSVDENSGEVTLKRRMVYITEERVQFRGSVRVIEQTSEISSTIELIINLVAENLHTPFFPAEHYVRTGVSEDVPIGYSVLDVLAVDRDPYDLGYLDFMVNDPRFEIVSTDGKTGVLQTTADLDYDTTGPEHKYEFTIVATDRDPVNPRSGTATVQVYLDNVEDEAPVFYPPEQEVFVTELTPATIPFIYFVQAYDPDHPVNGQLTFTFVREGDCALGSPTTCDIFDLDQNTGKLTLNQQVPKTKKNLELKFSANDGSQSSQGSVAVNFVGVNHPPKFPNCDVYRNTATIQEGMPKHTSIINITAVDDDVGVNGQLKFSLVGDHRYDDYFGLTQLDNNIAELTNIVEFKREDPENGVVLIGGEIRYRVTVVAEDDGNPTLSATCFFFVTIGDVNNNPPRFDDSNYEVFIHRTTPIGQEFLRVFAIDDDQGSNAEVVYSILSQPNNCDSDRVCFNINPTTGWLRIATAVPDTLNSVDFTVRAEDQGGLDSLFSDVAVKVTFRDSNDDLPPNWATVDGVRIDDLTGISVFENVAVGTPVDVLLKAVLPGLEGEVTYLLNRGRTEQENEGRDFNSQDNTLDQSMDLQVVQNLEYERVSQYILKLRASRKASDASFSDRRLTVNVMDVNNQIPEFHGRDKTGKYPAAVSDQTVEGDRVLTVVAIDLDGEKPNNLVTYHWGANCDDCSSFILDESTGIITANQQYDRQVKKEFLLSVVAQDGAPSAIRNDEEPNKVSIDVTVQVLGPSQDSPDFSKNRFDVQVIEGQSLFMPISTVTAVDPDPRFNYPQYMISEGNEEHLFAVDTSNGTIYNTGYLMYQQQDSYVLTYHVFDGRNIESTMVVINLTSLNIYPPVFVADMYEYSDYTEETAITSPLLLYQASATDPDDTRPNNVEYGIEGFLIQQNNFQIDADGNVYLIDPGTLDRDYPHGYSNWQFNLVAKDESSTAATKKGYAVMNILLKDLNDNIPVFDPCCFEGSVPENSNAGETVMNLVANDADEGENGRVTYELLSSPGNPRLFAVSPTGEVTTTQSNSLNREMQDTYEIIVRARDNGDTPNYSAENQTIYITVTDVNDNTPKFIDPPYEIDMPEEIPVGGSVVDILGEDADIGENSRLTFNILSGDDDNNFYFDNIYVAETGVLKIAKVIDYDVMPGKTFNLQISVADPQRAGSNSPTNLVINLLDINDNAPEFSPSEVIRDFDENKGIGFSVATFTATDPDTGEGGIFSYSIDYENTDQRKRFAIDPETGVVTIRNRATREEQDSYEVHILATDQGLPPQTGTATLLVTINDINNNAPNFKPDMPTVTVGENTFLGEEVARFTAIDLDTVENGPPFTFEYDCNEVECQDFTFQFMPELNQGTGILIANENSYNRYDQNRKYYELGIRMTDNPTSGQPQMSQTRILKVMIESRNDRRMSEDESTKDVVVYNYDEKFDDVPCGTVYVDDQDDDDLADKRFNCKEGCKEEVEGRTYEYFKVDSDTGEVTMNGGAPKGKHSLKVQVEDKRWDQTITATMNIRVVFIYGDAVLSSGSMRLSGSSGASLIRTTPKSPTKLEKFRSKLASLLGVDEGYVVVFSVLDVPGEDDMVDVQFSAHGSPYYSPARMNGIVLANKAEIQEDVGVTIAMSPVDLCYVESCYSGGCENRVITHTKPALVNTNSASFVGVNTTYEYECECKSKTYSEDPPLCDAYSCYNDGKCEETWNGFRCKCPVGFNGPRCQSTHVNFDGSSWAWFETLGTSQCADSRLSLDFITSQPTGLLLYNGPLEDPTQEGVPDFIAIWLDNGFVNARVNLGDDEVDFAVSDTAVNDGQWHTVEFIRQQKTLRLIVDHCMTSTIDESVNETTENRGSCESRVEYPGELFLLNVLSPLELGGRSNTNYPPNLPTAGFNGCVKNLMHDHQLYDLTVSRTQTAGSPSNVCSREQGCAAGSNGCPVKSSCIGNFNNDNKQCICDSGWRGDKCDTETTIKDIDTDSSFIEWKLKPDFNGTELSPRAVSLQIQYRSRQPDGMLFTASSFSKLEHLKLDLVQNNLRLRFDLGSDERDLWLSYVNASDGLWHVVTITRYGNQVILKMDHGEGKYYNESLPKEEHRLMFMHDTRQTFGGAEVYYKKYVQDPIVTDVLVSTCVTDVRVDNVWFPMTRIEDDQSKAADIVRDPNTKETCDSNACNGVTCPGGQICEDRWRMPFCVCPFGEFVLDGVCFPVKDCSLARCNHGYCVVYESMWRCICDEGWTGQSCNDPGTVLPPEERVGLTVGAIAAVAISILVVILLILLAVFFILRKSQKDPLLVDPDDDVRENVVYYDEEGAGEEDMHSYDLSRLQKPMGPGDAVMAAGKPLESAPHRDMPPLSGHPEPMRDPRMPFQPGENPDVGDFIGGRLNDADDDPNAPPYDSVREYEYEGGGSSAGSLSSIQTSSSGDLDFDYLNDLGPNFQKLADMYGAGQESEED